MTHPRPRNVNLGTNLLIVVAASAAIGHAQSPLARPQFEVAAIKENRSGNGPVSVTGLYRGDRLTATNVSLMTLISLAYKVKIFQISGAPSWVASDRFDIAAKADAEAAARSQMLPMLQALLEDRFQLATHRETKESPMFAITVAKNGPKIHAVDEDDCVVPAAGALPPVIVPGQTPVAACGGFMGVGNRVNGRRVSMNQLATVLEGILGRTVVDQTGLTGYFDFNFEWIPDLGPTSPGNPGDTPPSANSGEPSVFTALQEQLGLTAKSTRGPVDVLIIDHVERPSAN